MVLSDPLLLSDLWVVAECRLSGSRVVRFSGWFSPIVCSSPFEGVVCSVWVVVLNGGR